LSLFDYSSPIGTGCSAQNDCNGNGQCDFCTSQCQCFDGYGSEADKASTDMDTFANDCSTRRCPLGEASSTIAHGNSSYHALRECSNNGMCNRERGTCECFEGYTGIACSRRSCPGSHGHICSGRGSCLPLKHLAKEEDMYPLQQRPSNYSYNAQRYHITTAWDADSSVGCVCDSSWPVGYTNGTTQLAEYFGPSCEYKRCPSGDDPQTLVDETDCTDKRQTPFGNEILGPGLTGERGNKCHIDCSNRGTCDYLSGTCTCYPGFSGMSCNNINSNIYANGYSKATTVVNSEEAERREWLDILGYPEDS